jgi:hypothetical protein
MTGEQRNYTWMALIMPFMEQKPIYDQVNFGQPGLYQVVTGGTKGPEAFRSIVIKDYVCPSDTILKSLPHETWFTGGSFTPPISTDPRSGFGYTSYAGNSGWHTYRYNYSGADSRLGGPFQRYDASGLRDIKDGTSQTILLGETTVYGYCCGTSTLRGGTGFVRSTAHGTVFRSPFVAPTAWENAHTWLTPAGGPLLDANGTANNLWGNWGWPDHAFYPVYYYVNGYALDWYQAGSSHPSGAQFTLADGSVRFIPYTVAMGNGDLWGRYGNVWAAMHTQDGIADAPPNHQTPVTWQ